MNHSDPFIKLCKEEKINADTVQAVRSYLKGHCRGMHNASTVDKISKQVALSGPVVRKCLRVLALANDFGQGEAVNCIPQAKKSGAIGVWLSLKDIHATINNLYARANAILRRAKALEKLQLAEKQSRLDL